MKNIKDHFSIQSAQYARFRPRYPASLYDYLYSLVPRKNAAWDCGTGNGQVAGELSRVFAQVYATDISQRQIDQAEPKDNVQYQVCRAENTPFADNSFDLITVVQALHWFDFPAFFSEVKRTAKHNAILAAWGYGLIRISKEIDPVIDHFDHQKIGPYWDAERKHIDEKYQDIPFDFEEIKAPDFAIRVHWTLNALEGYLNTWSSVQKYIRQTGKNPVPELIENIRLKQNTDKAMEIDFPVFMRVGKVQK